MSSLKSRLLAPDVYVEKHPLFGTEVYLRRLTIAELDRYEQTLKKAQDSGSNTQASIAGANLILQTICDKAGQHLPKEELPTAKELIATKSTPTLIEALKFVQQFSCGSVWIALKKLTDSARLRFLFQLADRWG
ncbi:hypothetical protein ARAF_0476 [Arsenophonus endosymbiont of Aleurodicus floccissimus]|uniref:hypothetical protein n=1 Tax=Arsenophonus endosymbiont of Aleurodicus floccissimus TaxID=2152761 RepID=UPI000EE9DC56|nr:hypothetical protein [Arsenophonus endosymbiont of Aleurodicus floccissimus]SPP31352.1 hypothetical protein ARAF_0476 [Arsenophonus endosymbiont of Aleurodicus floccissimus]